MNNTLYLAVVNCDNITEDEIKEQIRLRKVLISEMVGTLYPQMVSSQIEKLESIIEERKYKESWDGMWEIE